MSVPQVSAASDDRGSITVEYVVLLVAVALGVVIAMAALGAPLVRMFRTLEIWIGLAFP